MIRKSANFSPPVNGMPGAYQQRVAHNADKESADGLIKSDTTPRLEAAAGSAGTGLELVCIPLTAARLTSAATWRWSAFSSQHSM